MNKNWLIVDSDALCHRVKHTMGHLSYNETPTGVTFGFLKYIESLREDFHGYNFAFCWDSRKSKRKEIYPEYKANRVKRYENMTEEELEFERKFRRQMILLRTKYLPQIGFRNIFRQEGYEADDLIASITFSVSNRIQVVIVSNDKDLYQLISENISYYDIGTHKLLTSQKFKKKYGIIPSCWATVKAIAGCSTDNIPGIKGVGEKIAIKYLRNELKQTSKAWQAIISKEGERIIRRNWEMVRLPFEGTREFQWREDNFSLQGWREVTKKLGMKSLYGKD